jgi:Tfp pilus assembly protein FimT
MKSGFSLLELMIVIGMIMIIACFALINTRSLHKLVVHNELALLQSTCSYLQAQAIANNEIQELLFDEQEQRYSYKESSHQLPSPVRIGILPGVKGPPSSPTTALSHAITFADKKITFHPDEIIGSGTIYLTDAAGTDLYALTSGISHVSFLRMYHYDGAWKLVT